MHRGTVKKVGLIALLPVLIGGLGGCKDGKHYYSSGGQEVSNLGGDSHLSVWKPRVTPGAYSSSQQWYSAGTGDAKQTIEGGWQVYPIKYDVEDPILFTYFTPDNYASGCYNLECPGFVQINSNWLLGGRITPLSSVGGEQRVFGMQWQLYEGNWWLFIKAEGDYEPVGYYPEAVFNSGALTASAESITMGGETKGNPSSILNPISKAGEMGSGKPASQGWRHAAYHRSISYIDRQHTRQWATLLTDQPYAACYSIDLENNSSDVWGTYFYFGGAACEFSFWWY